MGLRDIERDEIPDIANSKRIRDERDEFRAALVRLGYEAEVRRVEEIILKKSQDYRAALFYHWDSAHKTKEARSKRGS